jgi:hypothetical protein
MKNQLKKFWIFTVDDNTWPEHLQSGVAAINEPPKEWQKQNAIAEIIGIRPGDFIFFNLRVSDAHPPQLLGLYEATTKPFYDLNPIFPGARFIGVIKKYLNPYRVGFRQKINFPKPLNMDQIWLLRDRGFIWSIQQSYGDVIGRHACFSITVPEGKIILKMLEAANPVKYQLINMPQLRANLNSLPVQFKADPPGNLHYEGALMALLIENFAKGEFKKIVGEYDDFIPYFLTPARYEIDILLLKYDGDDIIWFGIVEAKANKITIKDIKRLIDYENWFIRTKVISPIQVHPIVIAYDYSQQALDYIKRKRDYDGRGMKIIKYQIQKNNLRLSEVSY